MGPEILSGEWIKVEDKQGKIMGLAMLPAGTAKQLGSHNFVEFCWLQNHSVTYAEGNMLPESFGTVSRIIVERGLAHRDTIRFFGVEPKELMYQAGFAFIPVTSDA